MQGNARNRRRFLKDGALLAGLAVGGLRSAGAQTAKAEEFVVPPRDFAPYGERSPLEEKVLRIEGYTPLQDLVGTITPAPLHYVQCHYGVPQIDSRTHRLMIHGMVERPLIFTMEELKRLPSVSRVHFLECADNSYLAVRGAKTVQEAHGRTSCSEWTGVLLSTLLNMAGVQKGASWVLIESADSAKHSKSIPMEKAMEDSMLAYAQNGEAVRPENGYPLRLLNPGWEGMSNVKWVRRLKVVDQPQMHMWESSKYSRIRPDGSIRWFQFQMGPKSVITRPSGGQKLPGHGFYEIQGLAWSGLGKVRRVEVSVDGGRSWKDAQLQEPIQRIAHTRFRFPWTWNGEETVLQSRCTDELGTTQPTLEALAKTWKFDVNVLKDPTKMLRLNHVNFIQPWKVTREGTVFNAVV
jgi:sulfane dehydrogenase subunit SoxC